MQATTSAAQAQATQALSTPPRAAQALASQTIVQIPQPQGNAGKDFKIKDAMGLEEDLVLY
ncbi:hypothetical protein H1R20_g13521, partial [Candolleomyces eurysporus]